MYLRSLVLLAGLLLQAAGAGASTERAAKVLRAYGPGGPHHVLRDCAELFREKYGVTVAVFKASPEDLAWRIREDGDIYYGGAEYMLENFVRENPDVIDTSSVEKLHPRRVGVVVRKGNPLNIKGIDCLQRDEVDLLEVAMERMRPFYPAGDERRRNIRRRVFTGQEGLAAWRSVRELDAWVTYKSWHIALEEEADFVEIPGERALRFTPVALTRHTPHRREAELFISFLKSPEARRIFLEHGWE